MLTDPKLRSQVDSLWDKFWSGGLTNPLDAIEQFSYLLFLKRMDDAEHRREKLAKKLGESKGVPVGYKCRYTTILQHATHIANARSKRIEPSAKGYVDITSRFF